MCIYIHIHIYILYMIYLHYVYIYTYIFSIIRFRNVIKKATQATVHHRMLSPNSFDRISVYA